MNLEEYRRRYSGQDDAAPGWDAIDARLREVYGDQEPKHWGIKYMIGGKAPLDGISAYQSSQGGTDHLHFCTYGYSSLYYDEESVGQEFSRYGFEMTFRLASSLPPSEELIWVCNLLENIARYVFENNRWFEKNQWIDANGPIKADSPTNLVGLAIAIDPELQPTMTPHGRVEFLQAFGITASELDRLKSKTLTCEALLNSHRKSNPYLITELSRV